MNDKLKELMDQRRKFLGFIPSEQSAFAKPSVQEVSPCFEIRTAEGYSEHFLDLRFERGDRVAFPYSALTYINFDQADSRIDLSFSGYVVSIRGQNLSADLYERLLDCRVRSLIERSQDPSSPDAVHISAIEIIPPAESFTESIVAEEKSGIDVDAPGTPYSSE